MSHLPLKGLVVLEFSQYLSGPAAGLRLADLGARVIKIERPGVGDAGRKLSIKNLWVDESSLLFHTINRNKESYAADLKNETDLQTLKKIIAKADVLIHNFRPGVMEKIGLGYAAVQAINPRLIYAEINGYGKAGPWKHKPGQDLLIQSIAGLTHTTGNKEQSPVPFGIAIADILCGAQLTQGILAALIRRQKRNTGALIEVSLMESLLDFQFELLTTYYADRQQPVRSAINNGHPLLSAPYGVYATKDGYLAIAMMDIQDLAEAIQSDALAQYTTASAFTHRDEIKAIIAAHLLQQPTAYWQEQLHSRDMWAMEVLNWQQLTAHPAYKAVKMEQSIQAEGMNITTTRCPIRINGERLTSNKPAPKVGADNAVVYRDFISEK
jgi:CoA:oxalate CoA-transferase